MSAPAVQFRGNDGRFGEPDDHLAGGGGTPASLEDPNRRWFLFIAELGVLALAIGTTASLNRLFLGWNFLGSLGVPVVLCWLSSLALRRWRAPMWLSIVVSVLIALFVLTWQFAPGTTAAGLPTAQTLESIRQSMGDSFNSFSRLVAPVEATNGFLVVVASVLWLFGFFADAAVFRYASPVQAAVPYGAAFVAIGILARDANRLSAAVYFLLGLLGYAVTQRALKASEQRWIRSETSRGATAVGSAAAGVALVAVLVGLLAGPLLPGSTDPVLDLRRLGQPGDSRTVISPFVGVRAQLGPQSNAEMFDVVSPVGAYWRLTSLERYDERRNIWVSEGTYARSDGNLDASPAGARSITQKFSINSLATIWLPAAFEPKAIRNSSVSVSYDKDSSSLIARGVTLEQGNHFTIQSVLPDLQAAALGGTAEGSDLDAVYHQKADLDPAVEALTRRIVASAVTPYDKALALQNYFRDGFIYDESVNYSDDADPVAAFLRDRRGFCQQFASTYALMARSIGLASRVAVGFTPGDPLGPAEAEAAGRDVPAGSADFVVRGRHAHAWPEVYFDKVGWVPFEPTPGRGNPQASDYTGVAPAQAAAPDDQAATTTELTTTTVGAGATGSNGRNVNASDLPKPNGSVVPSSGSGVSGTTILLIVVLLAALALAALVGRSILHARRRARRRHDPHGGRVASAWEESLSWLALIGIRPGPSETPNEFARRARSILSAQEVDELARAETKRRFASEDPSAEDAVGAERAARVVAERVRVATNRTQQLKRLVR